MKIFKVICITIVTMSLVLVSITSIMFLHDIASDFHQTNEILQNQLIDPEYMEDRENLKIEC